MFIPNNLSSRKRETWSGLVSRAPLHTCRISWVVLLGAKFQVLESINFTAHSHTCTRTCGPNVLEFFVSIDIKYVLSLKSMYIVYHLIKVEYVWVKPELLIFIRLQNRNRTCTPLTELRLHTLHV